MRKTKRRSISLYKTIRSGSLMLIAIASVIAIGIVITAVSLTVTTIGTNMQAPQSTPTIVIDAGHGGVDPGAIGTNKSEEKDINLAIALNLRDIMTASGWDVVMTRDEDVAIHDAKYKKISQIKTSDLKNRLKIIEDAPDAICISIHQNHFVSEASHGAQMFYGRLNPESKRMAEAMQTAFRENLQPDNMRQIKKSTSDIYIIHNAKRPIVLAECGFLSNHDECALLSDEEYQRKAAFTLYCGIVNYLEAAESEETSSTPAG